MSTAVEPREHTVELRGLRFHYVEWGEAGAPVMVALHGLSSMCRIWDPLGRAFQGRYRVIALDQRGHGDSSWPDAPEYRTDDYVADLEALIDGWGLERFVLIGLSMGGMNAMAYAARHPERVTHLVPVDIRPAFDYEKRLSYQMDKQIAKQGHPTFEDHETAYMARKMSNPHTPDESLRHHVQHLLKPHSEGGWVFKHDPHVSSHWRPSNLWDELPKVQSPVLIVRGGQSQVLPAEMAEQMRDAFPKAELVTIEEAAHTVPEDAPDAFVRTVDEFLTRYPA